MNTPRKPVLSWAEKVQMLLNWHYEELDGPEYFHLSQSFEDMADVVLKAMFDADTPRDMTPDNRWMTQQNGETA